MITTYWLLVSAKTLATHALSLVSHHTGTSFWTRLRFSKKKNQFVIDCGENFPAGAGDHLRPKTKESKEGTFFLQKEGGFGAFAFSVS